MKLIDLLIELRRDVTELLEGVDDASPLGLDRSRNNASTNYRIDGILKRYIAKASKFGIHLVTRHSQCGLAEHAEYYLVQDEGRNVDSYQDPAFDWTGIQLFQGMRVTTCPCAPDSPPRGHAVIEEFVIRKAQASRRHMFLAEALAQVQEGSLRSTSGRTRAAIREHLLRALLLLNDGILPQTVDEYIAASDVGTALDASPRQV